MGEILGRSYKGGCSHRIEYTDGDVLDQSLREENYAWGVQPPTRVGFWCRLRAVDTLA